MRKAIALFLALVTVLTFASFPAFAAESQKIALTEDNVTLTRTFDSGWVDVANFSNTANLFDGKTTTYSEWDQYNNNITTANARFDIVVDLGAEKNLSEIKFFTGVAGFGADNWSNAAPMKTEISVAGANEIYTSVFSYDSDTVEATRTDAVTLDPNGNGAKVRYIRYTSTKFARRATIAEIEVYEAVEVVVEPTKVTPNGANIRLASEEYSAGMRFAATIDRSATGLVDLWKEGDDPEVKFGMFLLPANKLEGHKTLTDYVNAGGTLAVDVPAKKIYSYDDNYVTYTAVLTDIPENGYAREILAVPYMLKDGEYEFFEEQANSYLGVAEDALEVYNNGNPNELTDEQVIALRELIEIGESYEPVYYDIDAAAKAAGKGYNNAILPASLFKFPNDGVDYAGYKIDGTYRVDADTLRMLTTVDVISSVGKDGVIKYKDYNSFTDYIGDKSGGEGCGPHSYGEQITSAPVSKLSDPLYMSMVLPSEGKTYMDKLYPSDPRNNGNNMHKPCNVSGCTQCNKVDYTKLNALGAVYLNQSKKNELTNYKDVQFKICLGNIRLLVNTASGGWRQVNLSATPTSGNGSLYCLPWQLEWNNATSQTYLDNCKSLTKVTRKSNYSEITLSVSDFFFSKTFTGTDGKSYTIDERVLHFWGGQYRFSNDADILGIIAAYDMWIEYDESIGIKLEDYFVSSIGADWRLSNGSTKQSFAGYKHAVSTEKITVFGHNIGPSDYDTLVTAEDLEYIKGVLGIQ